MRDRFLALVLRIQPGLSHRTVDKVALNSFALRARKRSQVLAGTARLYRHQLHRRTASRALRTLVLCIEHDHLIMSHRHRGTVINIAHFCEFNLLFKGLRITSSQPARRLHGAIWQGGPETVSRHAGRAALRHRLHQIGNQGQADRLMNCAAPLSTPQ
jgi:hypothetical protein